VSKSSDQTPPYRRLAALLDSLPVAVIQLGGRASQPIRVSAGFCAMVGLDPASLIASGPPFAWLADDQHHVFRAMVDAAADVPARWREVVLRHSDGADISAMASATSLSAPGGEPTVVVVLEAMPAAAGGLLPDFEHAQLSIHLANERARIARGLHDGVVQRLFAVGMELEATAELLSGGADIRERLWTAVDDIEAAMTELRTTIFTLHPHAPSRDRPLEALQATVESSGRLLGHHPELMVTGPLSLVPLELLDEVVTVVRELLMNVVKHAGSTASWVTVVVEEEQVTVSVEDDGRGPDLSATGGGGTGLRSIAERAEQLGGRAEVEQRSPNGTRVGWTVPFRSAGA
jgi:signal transduction histidine kinase